MSYSVRVGHIALGGSFSVRVDHIAPSMRSNVCSDNPGCARIACLVTLVWYAEQQQKEANRATKKQTKKKRP